MMKTLLVAFLLGFCAVSEAGVCVSWHYKDEIAQATCTAMAPNGWTYAVRRPCPSLLTCHQICQDPSLRGQDPQVKNKAMTCFNSLHVYEREELDIDISQDTQKLGLKVYKYGSCNTASCGPNFCCCRAI